MAIVEEHQMEENTFFISLSPEEAMNIIHSAVIGNSLSGKLFDRHDIQGPDGSCCITAVYERFFFSVRGRPTLTVVLDNFCGKTRVHYASGGGGGSLYDKDLLPLADLAFDTFRPYML